MTGMSTTVVSNLGAAKLRFQFRSKPCLRMTGLTTVAATPRITCRECKRMLRQQHAQTSMSAKSRIADLSCAQP